MSDNNFGRGGFGSGRGGFGAGRGGFSQPADNNAASSGDGGGFGAGRGGRGNFGGSRGAFSQPAENNGAAFGDSGGFGAGRGGRGNFGGSSRGAFSQPAENNASGDSGGGFGAGRGGRGNFGGGRGGFPQSADNNGAASTDGFGAGRGGRGNFGGSRGAFSQPTENNASEDGGSGFGAGRGSFGGGRGNFGGGRGGFPQSENNASGDGGGGFGAGRGSFGGGRGNFGSSRGAFSQPAENNASGDGGGGFGAGRGSFGGGRGNFGGGRGGFPQSADNNAASSGDGGGFGAGRGGRGNFGAGRGSFSQAGDNNGPADGEQGSRGGFGGGRGNFGGENHAAPEGEQGPRDGGETTSERAPINYVPKARDVEELYSEDQEAAGNYADVFDNDEDVVIENYSDEVVRMQKWEEAEFEPQLLTNIKERSKYSRPRKLQSVAIPFVLDSFDVKAQSETGSGKTAAFVLPIIDSCMKAKKSEGSDRFESELVSPFAIIIGPTRELVLQVFEQAEKFAAGTGVSVAKAYGQYNIGRNHQEIRSGCDILVATPGRLKQFVTNAEVQVKKLRVLVLDEADRLLDQNFSVDILEIVGVPTFPDKDKRQTLLFSATFPNEVMQVADQLLKPKAVFITNHRNISNKRIKQDFVIADRHGKLEILANLLKAEAQTAGGSDKIRRTLVFVNTKRMSDMAALYLCQNGVPSTSINGDRGQHLREEALHMFRSGKTKCLVATDVCARGLDVKQLDHVINMDMPMDAITYVHRVGRTGRIAQGYATTLIEGGEPILGEIADMMRQNGEEVPEALQSVLSGNGGGAASFGSSFVPPMPSADNVPVSGSQAASAPRVVPAAAGSPEDDW